MLTVGAGPIQVGVSHALLLTSVMMATLVGWQVGRKCNANPHSELFNMLVAGVVGARITFVALYLQHYRQTPWQVLDIRDGGFDMWGGVIAALLAGSWYVWRRRGARLALITAMSAGFLVWGAGHLVLQTLEQGKRLPGLALQNLQRQPVDLRHFQGKPVVINLWATWCPPCRREMPVLAEAQKLHTDVEFVFVNQGESEAQVISFLAAQNVRMNNILLDGEARLALTIGSQALPITLFYDAEGRQVASHFGELSRASLARALETLNPEKRP